MKKIKLFIVDDSAFIRRIIRDFVRNETDIEIVGEAENGREALDKIPRLKPDVVTLDIIMPMPDGLWTMDEINKQCPTPVIIFSSIAQENSDVVADAFRLGVFDVVQKPSTQSFIIQAKKELIEKIRNAALVDREKLISIRHDFSRGQYKVMPAFKVIAIGCSAGGPSPLSELLSTLPADLPAGIVVAQHMPENFITSFALHLKQSSPFKVKVGSEGDVVNTGRVLISPACRSMTVHRLKRGGAIRLDDVHCNPRPSINALFESVAAAYGRNTYAVVLSGMGEDGVEGLRAVKKAGGTVFAQDEKTAMVWGIPLAAINAGVVDKIMPVSEIVREIVTILKK